MDLSDFTDLDRSLADDEPSSFLFPELEIFIAQRGRLWPGQDGSAAQQPDEQKKGK
jgi:hypothetical protein